MMQLIPTTVVSHLTCACFFPRRGGLPGLIWFGRHVRAYDMTAFATLLQLARGVRDT